MFIIYNKKSHIKKIITILYYVLFFIIVSQLLSCCKTSVSLSDKKSDESNKNVIIKSDSVINIVKDIKSDSLFSSSEFVSAGALGIDSGVIGVFLEDKKEILKKGGVIGKKRVDVVMSKKSINTTSEFGVIVYRIPDTMKIDSEYIVSLRISRKRSIGILVGLVNGGGNLVERDIRVGDNMEVKLEETNASEGNFKITDLSSGVQSIENDSSYTTWEWSVRPIKGGFHRLKVLVVIKEKGLTKDIPVYEENIYIKSSAGFVVMDFIKENWQYLLGTIIIPFLGFIWKRRRDKKEKGED